MTEPIPNQWPNAFIRVKLSSSEGSFVFNDDIKHISNELLKLIPKLVEKSEKIPRPDHSTISSDRNPNLNHIDS